MLRFFFYGVKTCSVAGRTRRYELNSAFTLKAKRIRLTEGKSYTARLSSFHLIFYSTHLKTLGL